MSYSFDDLLQQNNDALQSTMDSTTTSLTDGQNFSHDTYSQGAFDHNSLTETAYQSDSFSTENQWQDTAFQNMPEHSLNQEIDALLNDSDSLDDSNSQNASNLTVPTFQHHVHYHPPHEHLNIPHTWEQEHDINHTLSIPTSLETHHVLHSSLDVNVSGSIDHHHRWVNPNNSYSDSGDSDSSSSYSNAPSSGTSSDCMDANGDGQCDSGGGSGDND